MKRIALFVATLALLAQPALAADPVLQPAQGGTGATTAAGARANLGAAASGANSDITSLNGLDAYTIDPTAAPYNAKCDDTTDDTAAINAAVAALQAHPGGGTLLLPTAISGTSPRLCLLRGALAPTYSGTNSPVQAPVRITSAAGASPDSYLHNSLHGNVAPIGGAGLDLQYSTSDGTHVAAIDTRGAGVLEIDHVVLANNGSGTIPLIQTTNTTLKIHDNVISGTSSCYQTTCAQDAIIFGGNNSTSDTTLATNASNSGFQGYSTVIEKNIFSHIRHVAVYGSAANAIVWENNTSDLTCGSAGNTYTIAGSISGTTLTVTSTTVPLTQGYIVNGASAGTYINAQLTGTTGSTGTYSVNNSQTVASVTSVTSPDAPFLITGAGYGATGNIFRDNTIEMGGYTHMAVLQTVSNAQTIKYNSFQNNGLYDETPNYTQGQLWVAPAATGASAFVSFNALSYSAADPTLGDNAVMGDPTAVGNINVSSATGKANVTNPKWLVVGTSGANSKLGVNNSNPGYQIDVGTGIAPAWIDLNADAVATHGPALFMKYAGATHGFFGPYTTLYGGAWDGIGGLLWYDGLWIGTNNSKYWFMDKKGHISYANNGAAPAVSIGTGATIDAHATDLSGTVTSGSGSPTTGTVTFNQAFTTWNHCRVVPHSAPAGWTYSTSLTAITVNATNLAGVVFDYDCDGL